jgi:ribosomal protein S18 acetylase RimI-like enzyme
LIRTAVAEDADAVVALWRDHAGPTRLASDRTAVLTLLARDPDALIVADDSDGVVIGTIVVGWDGWRCHLYRLAVHATARRRGVGRALVDAACALATRHGARRMDAVVDKENDAGIAFWTAAGFDVDTNADRWSKLL